MTDPILERAASLLRPVPDFPKPGILFFDLNPLLRDMEVMDHIATTIADHWRSQLVHVVAGLDSRGFLFGPMVAERLGVPFTMVRKKGKLPPPTKSVSYGLEYGSDVIEMADDGFLLNKRVLVIDDLLATGGTAGAAIELVHDLGGIPIGFACVTELPELGGRGKLFTTPVQSLITIMDDQPLVGVEYCVDIFARTRNDELVLVNRLGEVSGVAMPGGRMEPHESVAVTAARELMEETGSNCQSLVFCGMLTGILRDPRGPKVSVVVEATAKSTTFRGERGKTQPFVVASPAELPSPKDFVFGHGAFVHGHWQSVQDNAAKEAVAV